MTLTTHIIVGGALATPFLASGNIPGAFVVALASHYVVDAIPHWSYKMHSLELGEKREDRAFKQDKHEVLKDLGRVFLDVALGALILFLFLAPDITFLEILAFALIVVGAILPDGLQGVQLLYKAFPMPYVQRFHDFFHYENGGKGDLPLTFGSFLSQFLIATLALGVIVS